MDLKMDCHKNRYFNVIYSNWKTCNRIWHVIVFQGKNMEISHSDNEEVYSSQCCQINTAMNKAPGEITQSMSGWIFSCDISLQKRVKACIFFVVVFVFTKVVSLWKLQVCPDSCITETVMLTLCQCQSFCPMQCYFIWGSTN